MGGEAGAAKGRVEGVITLAEQAVNQQKYSNYQEQCKRLNKALAAGFNLEAMFIEYALM